MNRCARDGRDTFFLQPQHDLDLEHLRFVVAATIQQITMAGEGDTRPARELQYRLRLVGCTAATSACCCILVDQEAQTVSRCRRAFSAVRIFSARKPRRVSRRSSSTHSLRQGRRFSSSRDLRSDRQYSTIRSRRSPDQDAGPGTEDGVSRRLCGSSATESARSTFRRHEHHVLLGGFRSARRCSRRCQNQRLLLQPPNFAGGSSHRSRRSPPSPAFRSRRRARNPAAHDSSAIAVSQRRSISIRQLEGGRSAYGGARGPQQPRASTSFFMNNCED